MNNKLKVVLAMLVLSLPGIAQAVECTSECPSGQVMVGLLGGSSGNSVDCSCVDRGREMEDHPSDGNPPSGGEGQEQ